MSAASLTALRGGRANDPRRRKKKARPLPPTVRVYQEKLENKVRAIGPLPEACNGCGETIARHSLGCGTLPPGTPLLTGHVLENAFPFRLGLCSDCVLKMVDAGELEVTLQRSDRKRDPWPTGVGRSYDEGHHGEE